MGALDWIVLLGFLAYTIWDGVRSGKDSGTLGDYFLAGRTMPWWAMGLSIMATQASAITFISTTGLAFNEDMRFIQVYMAVPFAMAILSVTLVPYFSRAKSFTAYEVLEERFGLNTRLVTSFLFLISRGLALGTVIAAPAYVLALILEQPLWIMTIAIGLTATVYTMFGGISGVIRTMLNRWPPFS
jgi:Na+/proline symporter